MGRYSNRTSKKTYAYTTGTLGTVQSTQTYTYGDSTWGDRLTAYNGVIITYDDIGNPINYYNGSSYTFSWEDGRRLASVDCDEGVYTFTYNDEGIRTSKTKYYNDVTHYYTLDGSQILTEQWENKFIAYIYDENGAPIGMQYRTSSYAEDVFDYFYFEKNLQGDIIAVYNASGTKLVTYKYDAWGNHTATYSNGGGSTGAQYNPFRYRGYYYDTDLGLYYLNSRYYDSNIGRFISPDRIDVLAATPDQLTDKNLYTYCDNNPITREDGDGEFWHVFWGALFGGVFALATELIELAVCGDGIDLVNVILGTAEGALSAALGPVGGLIVSGTFSIIGDVRNGEDDIGKIMLNAGLSVAFSGLATSADFGVRMIKLDQLKHSSKSAIKGIVTSIDPNIKGVMRNVMKDSDNWTPHLKRMVIDNILNTKQSIISSNSFGLIFSIINYGARGAIE